MSTEFGRRDFLRRSVLGSTLVASAASESVLDGSRKPKRLYSEPDNVLELEEVSIADLRSAISSERETVRSLAAAYAERIDAVDGRGPTLRSVIEINPDLLNIAEALDRDETPRGPLHGVPVLLKDNIGTNDRMTTTAGSLALEGSVSPNDSFVAARLRESGALLLGKANLSEWANFRSTRSSSGWSARGGQCKNPYVLDRNPCGSSSGSAVAVSANLVALAIGTETDGSIVCPSSANGIVGIKPTVGLVSRAGIIPISRSQDTAGPMARSVGDAAVLLGVLAGPDPKDPVTMESGTRGLTDYTPFLVSDGLSRARIGVARDFYSPHEGVDRLFNEALNAMREGGATLVDPIDLARTDRALGLAENEVLLYEFKAGINAYLRALGSDAPVRSLLDLIKFNLKNASVEMPYFQQERFEAAQAKGSLSEPSYLDALTTARRLSRDGIDRIMRDHRLDAIVAPTGGPAWVTDLVNGDHFSVSSSRYAAVAGYPNISVPAGFIFGLPVGLSFFGRAWSEPTLIQIAYSFEQMTKHRRRPRFLPRAEVPA
jgi:amidase